MLRLMAMGRHGGIVGVLTMLAMLGYGELTTWNVSFYKSGNSYILQLWAFI